MRPTTLTLCALLALSAPRVAFAQQSPPSAATRGGLTVAGLRAPDGDNDLASELSAMLREEARAAGYEVPDNTPALDQEFAMIGCSTTGADCLSPIAADLHAQRFLYGSVLRSGRGRDPQLTIEVNLWDEGTRRESPPESVTVARSELAGHPEAVRALAQRMVRAVVLGRDEAAQQEAARAREAEAERQRQEEARARAASEALRARSVNTQPSHVRRWVGLGLIGAGVVMGGLAAWQWGRSGGLGDDSEQGGGEFGAGWARYDHSINHMSNGSYALSVSDVCARAAADAASNPDAAQANQLCDASSSAKTLAWVFGVSGLALAGAGAVFMVLDAMASGSAAREAEPQRQPPRARLNVSPVIGPRVGGVNLGLTF